MEKPAVVTIAEELWQMPGYLSAQRIRVHAQNKLIFKRNAEELLHALSLHANTKEIWYRENRSALRLLQSEICRLLHNFVSSASSLIDTTRVFYQAYSDGRFPEYQERVDATFKHDPLSRFVVGLRQYALHYSVPPLRSKLSGGQKLPTCCRMYLAADVLKEFSGWDKYAKRYIAESNGDVCLDNAVAEYFEKVQTFYDWFYERLDLIHADELAALGEKRLELRKAHYAEAVMFLQNGIAAHARVRSAPDQIFQSALAPDDFARAMASGNAMARFEAAVSILESYTSVPQDVVEKIKKAYVEFSWSSNST